MEAALSRSHELAPLMGRGCLAWTLGAGLRQRLGGAKGPLRPGGLKLVKECPSATRRVDSLRPAGYCCSSEAATRSATTTATAHVQESHRDPEQHARCS